MTNDDQVRSMMLTIADDGLDVDRTLDVLAALRRHRQRRRQAVSLLSAAAIVAVVVLLIGTSFGGLAAPRPVQPGPLPAPVSTGATTGAAHTTAPRTTAASKTTAAPRTAAPPRTTDPLAAAAPVTLVAFAQPRVTSPVRTAALDSRTVSEWHLEPGRLWVAWRSYASRIVQTPTNQPDESRGYVVSGSSIPVPLTDRETGTLVEGKESAATVNGHPAVLTTAPVGTVDAQGYPAQSRLSWKLPDGRTIHVFDTNPDAATPGLQQFANSIRDVSTLVSSGSFTVGRAPKGYQLQYADAGSFDASFSLCPVADPAVAITRCLTISSGTSTETGNGSGAEIQTEGDQHAVSNGTLYLQLSKNRAVLFGGTLGVEIDSGTPLTAAQFIAIAESVRA